MRACAAEEVAGRAGDAGQNGIPISQAPQVLAARELSAKKPNTRKNRRTKQMAKSRRGQGEGCVRKRNDGRWVAISTSDTSLGNASRSRSTVTARRKSAPSYLRRDPITRRDYPSRQAPKPSDSISTNGWKILCGRTQGREATRASPLSRGCI